MKNNVKMLLVWVLVSFMFTMTFGAIYLAQQQNYRLSANGQPFQIALDTAIKLNAGASANEVLPTGSVDIKQSLSPVVMIYGKDRHLLATNALLNGKAPVFPSGVLANVTPNGSRVTWQPEAGVRMASVTVSYSDGYVVAAQSLRETETLIDTLGSLVLLMWAFSVIAALIVVYVGGKVFWFQKSQNTAERKK